MSSSSPLLLSPAHHTRSMAGCVSALRCLVFTFNILFWVAGIILFALGAWLMWDPAASDFFALHSAHQGSFRLVALLLILAGGIMAFMGCCGCCGAWKMNQCALITFFFVLVLVFCLELAAAITAYNKQESIRHYIESSMYDTIRNRYASEPTYKAALDSVQTNFECCGVKSYGDWLGASWDKKMPAGSDEDLLGSSRIEHGIGAVGGGRGNGYGRVPSSCCNEHGMQTYPTNCGVSFNQAPLETYSMFLHEKGCSDALYDSVYSHLDMAICVCVVIGALQLLGMVLSMILCCCANEDQKKHQNY